MIIIIITYINVNLINILFSMYLYLLYKIVELVPTSTMF